MQARAQASKQDAAGAKPKTATAPAANSLGNEAFRVPPAAFSGHADSAAAPAHQDPAVYAAGNTALNGASQASWAGSYDYNGYAEGQPGENLQQEPAAGPAQPGWGAPSMSDAGEIPNWH